MSQPLTSTRYQKSIKSPVGARSVLKPGGNNKKLGSRVTAKRWKGKAMFSLTLVERETCSTTCHHWADCYGNHMPFAHRFSVEGIEPILELEISALLAMPKNKAGIVIRLHVLGDFASVAYVAFWRRMLKEHPRLALFGYTGWPTGSPIGKAVSRLNRAYPDACLIRFSRSESYAGDESYAAEEGFEGDCFTCPEQTGKVASCADCALCWTTVKTVRFLTH